MTTVIATPISQIKLAPGSAIMISGLTWKTYEVLLQELGFERSTRIAYAQGVLEIRMPGEFHEIVNRLLAKIITMLAMELGLEANDFGSVTNGTLVKPKDLCSLVPSLQARNEFREALPLVKKEEAEPLGMVSQPGGS